MLLFWILILVFTNAVFSLPFSFLKRPFRDLALLFLPFIALFLNILSLQKLTVPSLMIEWLPSLGLNIFLESTYFSLLFGVFILGIGLLIHIFATVYLYSDKSINYWHFWFFMFMGSMLGIVFSANLFFLFLFWELTSLASFFLIGFYHEQEEARKSAWEALLITGGGGLCLLTGFILLYIITGTADLPELKAKANEIQASPYIYITVALIVLGIFTKSAQFPFHFWLPDAMTAPAPASAYLHSATMVKAGIFLAIRLADIFSANLLWQSLLIACGGITFLLGAVSSVKEDSIKRALAYTTVSTLGLLTFLIGMGTSQTIFSAMLLLFAHAIYKAGLFLTAGAIEFSAHCKYFSKSKGLWIKHPTLFLTSFLLTISLAGLPFTFSFIAKEDTVKSLVSLPIFAMIPSLVLFVIGNILLVGFAVLFLMRPWGKNIYGITLSLDFKDYLLLSIPLLMSVLIFLIPLYPGVLELFENIKFASGNSFTNPAQISHGHSYHYVLLIPSILIWVGGIILGIFYNKKQGGMTVQKRTALAPQLYSYTIDSLIFYSDKITRFFQNGKLRSYLTTFSVSIILISTVSLVIDWHNISNYVSTHIGHTLGKVYLYDLTLMGIIIIGILGVIRSRSKLTAVICLGIVGYSIAVAFLIFSAPDLAMTQFIIETLTVALFVFVFYHLPEQHLPRRTWTIRRDVILSIIFGLIMGFVTLTASSIQTHPAISSYFASKSLSEAHGGNVVNVILVDFRGFDTLGEITVLAIAGIGTYALLRYQRMKNYE